MVDMVELSPWWYAVCGCDVIVEKYLGAFFCDKCNATDFIPVPKYRVKMVIEDETGAAFPEAYDHVMLPIVVVDKKDHEFARTYFPRSSDDVMGKSIMLIVEKTSPNLNYLEAVFELHCVSDDHVLRFYVDQGVCLTPSKPVPRLDDDKFDPMNTLVYKSPVTTTDKLLDEYLGAIYRRSQPYNDAESSSDAASKLVRPRLFKPY
ncbi:unnamed protein product [Trifolium pratense]|uniref:Uncharacterized protein n=1 Tax=Trifolium pratense TaxID=57577 RepID=A0ACB0K7N7_TRIPR|nr:unnamed protein product [Trifolium pratense]